VFLRVVLERKKESILCLWNLLRYHMKENKDKKIEEKKTKFMKRKKERKEKTLYRRKNRSNWEKRRRKKWEIEEKEKIKNMLRKLSSISWMAETGTAGVECVKDASTSLLEETACGSFGRTFCKCWACNPSHRALLLTVVRSVVPLLCHLANVPMGMQLLLPYWPFIS